jgi:murein DD-endopeptidase MepM/ murein hydrolase activator NlpD
LKEFTERYGAPEFDRVKFYPGAKKTTGFGIDDTFGKVRIHNAIDRAGAGSVYVPFDATEARLYKYPQSFGYLLVLPVEHADFEVRIGHFDPEEFTEIGELLHTGERIPAGTEIGPAGSTGKSTGRHTHTEIVSTGGSSEVLDQIVVPGEKAIFDRDVTAMAEERGWDVAETLSDFRTQQSAKGILHLTTARCVRMDYRTGAIRTFYSSWDLFNQM